jgi:hypothetical protein
MTASLLRTALAPLLLAVLCGPSAAQRSIAPAGHAWAMYFGTHRLANSWNLHTEYQWRRADWGAVWQQSLLRVGLERSTPSGAAFTAGYGWIRTFPYGEQPIADVTDEHRIWEQVAVQQELGRVRLHHRYRFEQRFLETASGHVLRHRVRYRAAVTVPLRGPVFLTVYDEVFAGWGPGIARNVLDQNRLYAALGYRLSHSLQLQAGYLNQFVLKPDGMRAENNHTLQLGIFHSLDLRPTD